MGIGPRRLRKSGMSPTGLYRAVTPDGRAEYVFLDHGVATAHTVSRALYEKRGYQPPFDKLPTKEAYDARKALTAVKAPAAGASKPGKAS